MSNFAGLNQRMRGRLHQIGDTIIEVMLALAVIGLVLGASFGIANRSVIIGRNAQERGEALKQAERQIELIKAYTNIPENREALEEGASPTEQILNKLLLDSGKPLASTAVVCMRQDKSGGIYADIGEYGKKCVFGLYQVSVGCISGDTPRVENASSQTNTCEASKDVGRRIRVSVVWERLGGQVGPDNKVIKDNVELYYSFGG